MDDPIFGPWGAEPQEPPVSEPASAPRWRASRPVRYEPIPAQPSEDRLGGVRGFLRTMAVPRLEALVQRLREARHDARMEDLLAESPPLIRLEMRPWKGPLGPRPNAGAPFSTLEIELEEGAPETVVVRTWIDPTVAPTEETRAPIATVRAGWLEESALRFVEGVLGRV